MSRHARRAVKATGQKTPIGSGTIGCWLNHRHKDWAVNNQNYKFGPIENEHASLSAFKKSDHSLEVRFTTSDFSHTFSGPMPEASENGVHIAVTWTPSEITLYANGKPVSTVH